MKTGPPFFFFNDPATTEIYTLSLHDALPISLPQRRAPASEGRTRRAGRHPIQDRRSEEHTSELQSQSNLVCRLLLEKKNGDLDLPYDVMIEAGALVLRGQIVVHRDAVLVPRL